MGVDRRHAIVNYISCNLYKKKKTVGKINGILGCVWIFLINLFEIRNLTSKKKNTVIAVNLDIFLIYTSPVKFHTIILWMVYQFYLSYFFKKPNHKSSPFFHIFGKYRLNCVVWNWLYFGLFIRKLHNTQ